MFKAYFISQFSNTYKPSLDSYSCFERVFHVIQANLKLSMWLQMTLKFGCFCLYLLSAGI